MYEIIIMKPPHLINVYQFKSTIKFFFKNQVRLLEEIQMNKKGAKFCLTSNENIQKKTREFCFSSIILAISQNRIFSSDRGV
jgi:hypothetical protein